MMAVETDPFVMIEGMVNQARRKVRAAMEAVGDELLHELKVEVSTLCPNYPNAVEAYHTRRPTAIHLRNLASSGAIYRRGLWNSPAV